MRYKAGIIMGMHLGSSRYRYPLPQSYVVGFASGNFDGVPEMMHASEANARRQSSTLSCSGRQTKRSHCSGAIAFLNCLERMDNSYN